MEPRRFEGREARMGYRDVDPVANRLSHDVIGAAIEVHRLLGPGFLEIVYERALAVELALRGVHFQRQAPVGIAYKGFDVGKGAIDILVDNVLVVELKAQESLRPIHTAQVLSYLKARNLTLGLLINFHVHLLKDGIQRVIRV